MTQHHVTSGPELDTLVARKIIGDGVVRPFSTHPGSASLVMQEIASRGFDVDFDEFDVVFCSLTRGENRIVSSWGETYEEALCRAGLKLLGNESA